MSVRQSVLQVLPWGAALWASVSASLVVLKGNDLCASATAALALDAVTSAVAVRPLGQRRSSGWWLLFGPIVAQPVFAAIDLRQDPEGMAKAIGRTLGATLGTVALLTLRQDFDSQAS